MQRLTPMAWRIGITGGIGSGKSNVCAQLRAHGLATIDADILGAPPSFVGASSAAVFRLSDPLDHFLTLHLFSEYLFK